MANTVVVGTAAGTDPTVYPCTINGSTNVSIVVTAPTLALIPSANQSTYVQARALRFMGDNTGATTLVTPLATGSVDANGNDTRNWAQLWLDGLILS